MTKWDKLDIDDIRNDYLNSLSILNIAEKHRCSFKVIRKALLRNAVPLRKTNTVGLHQCSEETKNKIRLTKLGVKNPNWEAKSVTEKTRQLHREAIRHTLHCREIWQKSAATRVKKGLSKGKNNPMSRQDVIKKWIVSNQISPNKKELFVQGFLDKLFPNEYKLNVLGNYLILGGKVPDFVSLNNKKLIEFYGDYWHRNDNEIDRINFFEKYGYQTLVVWENELKNLITLQNKITIFHAN